MIALTRPEDACAACKIIISYLIKRRTAVRTESGVLGKLGAALGTELCCSGNRRRCSVSCGAVCITSVFVKKCLHIERFIWVCIYRAGRIAKKNRLAGCCWDSCFQRWTDNLIESIMGRYAVRQIEKAFKPILFCIAIILNLIPGLRSADDCA